jgi:hypothetical protein
MSGFLSGGDGGNNITTDAQHGNRGGGSLHSPAVSGGANGFMLGTDKAKLDGVEAGAQVTNWARVAAALGGQAGAVSGLVFKSDGAGGGSMVIDAQNIQHRIIVGKSGDVDYTSLKAAVDFVATQSPTSANQFLIEVYPGTYTEMPMTLPSGVYISSATGQIQTPVIIVAADPSQDLFTLTGGAINGLQLAGVTDAVKCLVRVSNPSKIGVLINCTMNSCSNGLICDSGATTFILGISCTIKAPGQAITVAGITADNGSVLMTNGAFNAPQALDAFYATNMIEKCVYVTNGGSIEAVSCAFRVFGHNASQVVFFVENGGQASVMSTHFGNSVTALNIGSAGANSVISCQAISLKNNTTNFKIESSTGAIFANASTDTIKSSIVAGGKLSGIVQERDSKTVELVGDLFAKFNSGRSAPVLEFLHDQMSTGVISGGVVTYSSPLVVAISAGSGWISRGNPDNDIRYVTWAATTVSVAPSATNYVYYDDNSDAIVSGVSEPGSNHIQLALAITNADIRFIHTVISRVDGTDSTLNSYLLSNRKIILDTGLGVSVGSTSSKIDIASGSYYRALFKNIYGGAADALFSYFYGSDGATEIASQSVTNNTQYDSSGALATMTALYFKSDTVVLTSDGKISIIFGTAEYAVQNDAANTPTAFIPTFLEPSAIVLASIIIQKSVGIVQIVDRRPVGAASSSGGSVTDHGLLSGLLDDDHTQYLLTNGARAMAGNLAMGGNAITSVGLVDGVTVSAHASRHNPGGIDALATAAPVALLVGVAASQGSAASLARSDHQHGVAAGPAFSVGSTSSSGSASTVSRSDHVHGHGVQTDGTFHAAATGSVSGFMSSTDKSRFDMVVPGTITAISAGGSNVNGVSTSYSRTDHVHGLATATPVTLGTVNTAGVATSVAASDHIHAHGAQTDPSLHAVVVASVSDGFMAASDKAKLDGISAGAGVVNFASVSSALGNAVGAGLIFKTDGVAGSMVLNLQNIKNRYTVGQGTDVDFTSVFDAINYVTGQGPTKTNQFLIEVYPGTYNCEQVSIVDGIFVVAVNNNSKSDVKIVANDNGNNLFLMNGGVISGLSFYGVSDPAVAQVRVSNNSFETFIFNCEFYNCSNGVIVEGGATANIIGGSTIIDSDHLSVGTSIFTVLDETILNISNFTAHAPKGYDGLYSSNMIQRCVYANASGTANISNCLFDVFPKDVSQDICAVGDKGFINIASSYFYNSNFALNIPDGVGNSKIFAQSCFFKNNLVNFRNHSDSSSMFCSAVVDKVFSDIIGLAIFKYSIYQGNTDEYFISGALIDGLSLSAHGFRHNPDDLDPIAVGTPVQIGTSNSNGSANSLARSDHQHNHGDQSVGTHHAAASSILNGFMSSVDKTRFDLVTPGAPIALTPGGISNGVATSYARADHQHGILTAIAVSVGTANAIGVATTVSRSDHVHAHGAQTDGTLHAVATGLVNGFMSSTDKSRLDTVIPGAISAISLGAATSNGTSANYARSDHTHGTTIGVPVSVAAANAAGTSTSFSAADHVHAHGSLGGGTTHAVATGASAGFLSATDKTKLDALSIVSTGTATLNFGSAPGTNIVTTTVTGQTSIASTSLIRAFFMGDSTVDHNAYEHQIMDVAATCTNIVAGTGFDIVVSSALRLTGTFKIRWQWV